MLYRRHKAYILAIHGCKYWAATGFGLGGADMYIEDNFNSYHYIDGGTALDCLVASPTFSQVIDVTGGFGRVADASFEIIDTHDDYFAKFFAASKVDNAYTRLTATLGYTDGSAFVEDSEIASVEGTNLCLPGETIRANYSAPGQVSVTRSLYSCFIEGRWATHNEVTESAGQGAALVAGGHWNHSGRWVCVYEAETDYTGQFGAPKRIYAGTISATSVDGRKITISTKSVTTLLSAPLIIGSELKIVKDTSNSLTEDLWMYDRVGAKMMDLDPAVDTNIFSDINDFLQERLNYYAIAYGTGNQFNSFPGFLEVLQAGTPNHDECPQVSLTHPALVKFYSITGEPHDVNLTYPPYSDTTSTYPRDESVDYDAVVMSGFTFTFDPENGVTPNSSTAFFLFDNEITVPCVRTSEYRWAVSTDTALPWFDKDGNFLDLLDTSGRPNRWLCINKEKCSIKAVLCPTTETNQDLISIIYQLMTSTGASVNPNESGDFSWWQSMAVPYYLVDFDTFRPIYYPLRPIITDPVSLASVFESPLKIAGYRIIWSFEDGKIKSRQCAWPSINNALIDYSLSSQSVKKPSTEIGYQAPMSTFSIEIKKLNWKVSMNMNGPISQYNDGLKVDLVDEHGTEKDAILQFPVVAYNNLRWLSETVPSTVIDVDHHLGEVGDTVTITNKYVVSGDGYGVVSRAGMQTEIQAGMNHSIRVLFAGNTTTDQECLLAPSAEIDLSVGTYGLLDGELYLKADPFRNDRTFCDFTAHILGTTAVSIAFVSALGSFVVEGTTLDVYTNRVIMPVGWTATDYLIDEFRAGSLWITVANYWQYGS